MRVSEGKEIQVRGNIDQRFSKTSEKDTKTQIKEAKWIPGSKNTNTTILRPIVYLTAKNLKKKKILKATRGNKSLPVGEQ